MESLARRLEILMDTMGWDEPALGRAAGVTRSAVSQWFGRGSKEIKSIGDIEVAVRLAEATGFSPLWIAKGKGPQRKSSGPLTAAEPGAGYTTDGQVLERMGLILAGVKPDRREAVAECLAGWARERGADHWRHMLLAAIGVPEKQRRAG